MLLTRLTLQRRPAQAAALLLRPRPLHTARTIRPSLHPTISSGRRTAATAAETGENNSGHIKTKQNEGILFFDNVYPLKLGWLNRIPFFNADQSIPELFKRANNPDVALADPSSIIRRAMPASLPMKVTEVMPRLREGGAYVKFSHEDVVTAQELESTLQSYMNEKPIRPWFNPFRKVEAFLVRGKPWIEDLYRLPSARLKIEFLPTAPENSAAELTQEKLFTLFRKYGKLTEIIPQPQDSKVLPKYAHIEYARMRFATMGKNCMHGFILGPEDGGGKTGTVLKISYESKLNKGWIRDWITSHPRIVIPILVAILTAASVAVFDPIRTFFIRMHLTHNLKIEESPVYKWLRKQLTRGFDIITFRKRRAVDDSLSVLWEDRHDAIQQLQTWMIETADTFIVVQGPRGAGKRELVMDQALQGWKNKLVIDCKRIQEARGDSNLIEAAAAEVGYWPVFSWMNSISSMIDLAAMGTIGTKTGFSETVDNQLAKIWGNTATALKKIAVSNRSRDDKDAYLSDDDWIEAHPEQRPVVIIDNFLHKSGEGNATMVYDKLAEWGARLTTSNIAHVIFLTTDVSFSKSLSKALPDRVFRLITLGDCTPEVAKKLVIRVIDSDEDDPVAPGEQKLTPSQLRSDMDELDGVIQVLGGRLTDLEFLARRIKGGESPGKAVRQIIEQSASEILKMYLLDVDAASRKWTAQQAWLLVKDLAANETLKYNEVLLNDLFKNGDAVLQALEQAELITITSQNGRPYGIKPGKPVYQAAFEYLTEDKVLKCRMNLAVFTELIALENKNIDKFETELKVLGELPGTPAELKPRIAYLLHKASVSQANIEKYDAECGKLKKVLKENF